MCMTWQHSMAIVFILIINSLTTPRWNGICLGRWCACARWVCSCVAVAALHGKCVAIRYLCCGAFHIGWWKKWDSWRNGWFRRCLNSIDKYDKRLIVWFRSESFAQCRLKSMFLSRSVAIDFSRMLEEICFDIWRIYKDAKGDMHSNSSSHNQQIIRASRNCWITYAAIHIQNHFIFDSFMIFVRFPFFDNTNEMKMEEMRGIVAPAFVPLVTIHLTENNAKCWIFHQPRGNPTSHKYKWWTSHSVRHSFIHSDYNSPIETSYSTVNHCFSRSVYLYPDWYSSVSMHYSWENIIHKLSEIRLFHYLDFPIAAKTTG